MVGQHQIDRGLKWIPPTSTCVMSHIFYDSRLWYRNKAYTISIYTNRLNINNVHTCNIQQFEAINEMNNYAIAIMMYCLPLSILS